jgi:hypothetical protein
MAIPNPDGRFPRGIKAEGRRASPTRPHAEAIWLIQARCIEFARIWLT